MIDATTLLSDTKALVRDLVDDLRSSATTDGDVADVVDREHRRAAAAGRTALGRAEWAEGLYAQIAVAWVLGAVFVRFCEDNDLVAEPLLAGPGTRRAIALEHRSAYLRDNPAHDDRDWLREVFARYRALPATGEVFGDHNPIWLLAPSADGARRLVQEVQAVDPDTGELRHDFTDPSWDTRFLGDLYQDLSEHAKKTYALLQTPVFVEEFILDRTLDPAIATFGLREVTAIDVTCGSGHFVLGIFARLFARWTDAEPGTNPRELARRSLDAIGGVDLNPFAASIARFRLLVAALRAGGDTRLADAPNYPIHIAVGDSLLHGDRPGGLPGMSARDDEVAAQHGYETEDLELARSLLSRSWHVVVGNPPYVTVKDPALSAVYRLRYKTCHRQYSLGVPFTERFFQLARQDNDLERAGYVGMITANSFMKREFGKKLIEDWVPKHDLTLVIDTSGAHIPGHGTPTVILFGRNRRPVSPEVRAVMSIRGEPSRPAKPEKGLVWSSIVEMVDEPGAANDFVSVTNLDRTVLVRHPWSFGGGGAAELKASLDTTCKVTLGGLIDAVGRTHVLGEDDVWILPGEGAARRFGMGENVLPFVTGDAVRDWRVRPTEVCVHPYEGLTGEALPADSPVVGRYLWPYRSLLRSRTVFSKTLGERGLPWWVHLERYTEKLRVRESIVYAEVATHNHFVLDSGGKVFNRSAPVIKLPATATRLAYLELLGALNSSTAMFWMKQTCFDKGNRGEGGGITSDAWERFIVRDGTKLQACPMPKQFDVHSATTLSDLTDELSAASPEAHLAGGVSGERLRSAQADFVDIRSRLIAAQEYLDWRMYRCYGLLDDDLAAGDEPEPPLQLGERAFEIVLARRVAQGEEVTSWFERHGSTPITELPPHWPEAYKRVVERRIDLIETDLNIGLIERPEYKRRWATKPWDEQVKVALRSWLLDRLEDGAYWPEPAAITTVARLAADVRSDPEFMQVARLYAGRDDVDVAAVVAELVKAEAVPYLAALRYTDPGLRKHAEWLATWDLQRREDAREDVGPIPAPSKYVRTDFTGVGWNHRGKLDVPKERFVSYPGAERETDASLPIGWAGWDHLARARALATWYLQAKRDGRDAAHLTPLLAGLAELVPWLKQWHDDPNPDPALDRPGTQIAGLVDAELRALHLTPDDLTSWRPTPGAGRRRR